MTDMLELAIKNLQGKATVAQDKAIFHHDRARIHTHEAEKYEDEAERFAAAIKAIEEVMGTLPGDETEVATEQGEPFHDASTVPASLSAAANHHARQAGPAVFDRADIRLELHLRHMYYPLAKSHRNPSLFQRQCLISACIKAPGYDEYLRNGGFNLSGNTTRTVANVDHAIKALGIDYDAAVKEAKELWNNIYEYGIEGTDYI